MRFPTRTGAANAPPEMGESAAVGPGSRRPVPMRPDGDRLLATRSALYSLSSRPLAPLQTADDGRIANLPIAIVHTRDCSGAHHTLQLETRQSCNLADRLFECDLNLGQGRDRHPWRQLLVEHVVHTWAST